MSHRVREVLYPGTQRPVRQETSNAVVLSGLAEALERADRELRAAYPDIFAEVDRIKARPNWCGSYSVVIREAPHGECLWCGDFWVGVDRAKNLPPQRFCSSVCGRRYNAWQSRREAS